MKKGIVLLIVILCIGKLFYAQQDAQFAQYFDNTLYVNPAYAGSRGMMNATIIHREQWVGFSGRPRSTTFSFHSPLKYESIGTGITVVSDETGPVKQTMIYGDISYRLKFKNNSKLVFGIKGGMNMITIDKSPLNTIVDNDQKIVADIRNNINPNFGAGIFYHTPKFFFGLSTPKILEQSYDNSSTNMERRHFFLVTGGVFKVNQEWKARPSIQAKYTYGAPLSLDISLAGIYNEKFWIGALYRVDAAFAAFEVLLSYDFTFKKEGIRSPRYF